jgi:hypothetical protein
MSKRPTPDAQAAASAREVFADLRRHNEYAARVARLLEAKRKRRVEQVVRLQRKHRLRQAR